MKKINIIYPVLFLFPLLSFSQNGVTIHPLPSGYTLNQLRYRNDLKTDASNNIWVAFRNIGLGKFDGVNWTVFNNTNSSFPDTTVYTMGFDLLNNLWAGGNKGLTKYDGTNWTNFNTLNSGLPDDTVKAVTTIGNNIWCGTNKGVAMYDGVNWTIYNTLNSGIANDTINAFAFGTNGEAWIGTNNGLSKFYQGVWTNFDTINSAVSYNYINYLLVDANNKLWIGSGKYPQNNIDVLTGSTINNFLNEIYTGAITVTISRQSMAKNQQGTIYGNGPALIELSSGNYNLYFGVMGGSLLGTAMAFDNNNILWGISRLGFGSNDLYSFDMSQYNGNGTITNQNFKYLDVNNVKAGMLDFGMMHWDLANSKYEVPKGSGKTSVFASALWIGGLDKNNQLHVAAQTYRQTGTDFWPGPIDTVSGKADSNSVQPYDKIWKVNRFDVEDFKYNFLNGNVGNGTYPVPPDMLTWPAQGTGNITRDLAPYVDYNGDGNYNSYDGDYPLIKGDQMLYWIFNDNLDSIHGNTLGLPLGFEIHASAYAYTCPNNADSNSVLNTTTFYNYRIINRSSNDYDSLFIGLFCDVDLGDAVDDYVGCDSIHNAGFGYNADNDDGTFNGYGLNPPMLNIQILKGPLAKTNDNIDNDHDGTIDEAGEKCMMDGFIKINEDATPCSNPQLTIDYYYYMSNRWKDGSHLMYNTNCGSITTPTDFMYCGTPYDSPGWTEANAGIPAGDRRMLVNSGPFSLAAGEETSIDFAYVWTRDSTAPNGLTTSIARNIADLQRVKNWFDIDSFPSCLLLNVGTNELQKENNFLSVHPNPAADKLYIEFPSNKFSGSTYQVTDMLGRTFITGNLKSNYVNINRLPSGLYALRIDSGGQTFRQKFVKK